MFYRLWLKMIMRQEEKIISLISYYALPTASRKYFFGLCCTLISFKCIQILQCFIIDITDALELHSY